MGRRALLELYRLDPESKTPVREALRLHHLLPNSSASADECEVGVKGKGSKMSCPLHWQRRSATSAAQGVTDVSEGAHAEVSEDVL